MRADVWRLLIVQRYGGVTLDSAVGAIAKLPLKRDDTAVLSVGGWSHLPGRTGGLLEHQAMAFAPDHPFINEVVGVAKVNLNDPAYPLRNDTPEAEAEGSASTRLTGQAMYQGVLHDVLGRARCQKTENSYMTALLEPERHCDMKEFRKIFPEGERLLRDVDLVGSLVRKVFRDSGLRTKEYDSSEAPLLEAWSPGFCSSGAFERRAEKRERLWKENIIENQQGAEDEKDLDMELDRPISLPKNVEEKHQAEDDDELGAELDRHIKLLKNMEENKQGAEDDDELSAELNQNIELLNGMGGNQQEAEDDDELGAEWDRAMELLNNVGKNRQGAEETTADAPREREIVSLNSPPFEAVYDHWRKTAPWFNQSMFTTKPEGCPPTKQDNPCWFKRSTMRNTGKSIENLADWVWKDKAKKIVDLYKNADAVSLQIRPILAKIHRNKAIHQQMEQLQLNSVFDAEAFGVFSDEAHEAYGDSKFMQMMWMKTASVWAVLREGYHVLFQDVDLVWFRDPYPFLTTEYSMFTEMKGFTDNEEADLLFMHDGAESNRFAPYWGNSGFFYLKSNGRTKSFWERVISSFDLMLEFQSQQAVIDHIAGDMCLLGLKVNTLCERVFANGRIYEEYEENRLPSKDKFRPLVWHINWTIKPTLKFTRMKNLKLWYYNETLFEKIFEES
ncbi:hypothetical protein ACHAWF_014503 [Thalassiosira exigua]